MDLSIIIPAYNAKDTLNVPLESIKKQKIKIEYEVIIVNDASSYDYSSFVKKYSPFFKIREIRTNHNVGPGGARQLGIDNSKAKYIVFIDSDDSFFGLTSLDGMYQVITSEQADLLIGNFIHEKIKYPIIKSRDLTWLHGKMYKRAFLDKYKIRFNNSRSNEDTGFNRLILLLHPKAIFYDRVVYIYKQNPNSITRKNDYEYYFTGIEGFCYNINWAIEEALKRGSHIERIGILYLDTLMTLYFYYLKLEKQYDVAQILIWGKELKKNYYKYNDTIDDNIITLLLNKKKQLLENDFVISNFHLTFNEFLEKI